MISGLFPPKTRPLIGSPAGSANQRPGFWQEMAGIHFSISTKFDYNFNKYSTYFQIPIE